MIEAGLRRLDRTEKEVKSSNLEGDEISSFTESLLENLNTVLTTPTLQQKVTELKTQHQLWPIKQDNVHFELWEFHIDSNRFVCRLL